MPRTPFLSAALIAVAVIGCTSPQAGNQPAAATPAAPDPAAVRATIEATEKQWSAAFLKGDAAGIAALYSEDGATIPASGDWGRGRAGVTKTEQEQLDPVDVATREDITEEVTVSGDYAVEIGHYSWTGKAKKGGAARGETGRYMVLWHKDADGTWRLFRDIGAVAVPAKK